jgi:hypothetical protein
MRKFSIALLMIPLFMTMSYADAQDDPCVQFTSQQEKNVCYNMMQGLSAHTDDLVKEHSMAIDATPEVSPSSDLETPPQAIKLPPTPGQEPQQEDRRHRNIFQ